MRSEFRSRITSKRVLPHTTSRSDAIVRSALLHWRLFALQRRARRFRLKCALRRWKTCLSQTLQNEWKNDIRATVQCNYSRYIHVFSRWVSRKNASTNAKNRWEKADRHGTRSFSSKTERFSYGEVSVHLQLIWHTGKEWTIANRMLRYTIATKH